MSWHATYKSLLKKVFSIIFIRSYTLRIWLSHWDYWRILFWENIIRANFCFLQKINYRCGCHWTGIILKEFGRMNVCLVWWLTRTLLRSFLQLHSKDVWVLNCHTAYNDCTPQGASTLSNVIIINSHCHHVSTDQLYHVCEVLLTSRKPTRWKCSDWCCNCSVRKLVILHFVAWIIIIITAQSVCPCVTTNARKRQSVLLRQTHQQEAQLSQTPRDASSLNICQVTQDHSRSFEMTPFE